MNDESSKANQKLGDSPEAFTTEDSSKYAILRISDNAATGERLATLCGSSRRRRSATFGHAIDAFVSAMVVTRTNYPTKFQPCRGVHWDEGVREITSTC